MTMVNDATEAALGLLGLTGSIDFTTTSTIPLKRKPSTSFLLPDDDPDSSNNSSDSINCICGYSYDDGFSVACDDCSRWVHAACFDISEGEVPEEWRCWVCEPRKVDRERAARLQRQRQRKLQEEAEGEKQNMRRRVSSPGVERKRRASAAAIDGSSATKRKRRYSVSTTQAMQQQHSERQHSGGHQQSASHQHPHSPVEDEHIDIDEPATHSYVHIEKDIIPHQYTRDKLKRLAQHWRGVTALDAATTDDPTVPVLLTPEEFPSTPQTSLHPLPRSSYSHPTLSSHMNPSVRPPSYTVRTTQPIPSSGLIAPYTSTIIPSTVYLSDPLNSYAHLGMPKPFVHLMGPPLDLALDARLAGNSSRYVRSGCRPNAVLRPMLCRRSRKSAVDDDTLTFGVFALRDLKAHEEVVLGWEWDDGSVIHHLPALIDSPHVFAPPRFQQFRHQMTSMLHALSSTFTTCACGARTKDCALNRLAEFVDGQTPPTPSPSPPTHHAEDPLSRSDARDRDEGPRSSRADLGPLIGVERGFRTKERVPMSGGMSGVEMVTPARGWGNGWHDDQFPDTPDAGPSRLAHTDIQTPLSPKSTTSKTWDRKGKARATDDEMEVFEPRRDAATKRATKSRSKRKNGAAKPTSASSASSSSSPRTLPVPQLVPENEEKLPPKFRKKWIHEKSDSLSESPTSPTAPAPIRRRGKGEGRIDGTDVEEMSDDAQVMPPPPLPPPSTTSPPSRLDRLPNLSSPVPGHTSDPTSPTASFANLSLLSPAVNGTPGSSNSKSPQSENPVRTKTEVVDDIEMRDEPSVLPSAMSRRPSSPLHAPLVPTLPRPSSPSEERQRRRAAALAQDVTASGSQQVGDNVLAAVAPVGDMETEQEAHVAPAAAPSAAEGSADPTHLFDNSQVEAAGYNEPAARQPSEDHEAVKVEPPKTPPRPAAEEPPPPKVKLSLKDFAMRKRKQREEENKASASPSVPAVPLASEPDVTHAEAAHKDKEEPVLPSESLPDRSEPISEALPSEPISTTAEEKPSEQVVQRDHSGVDERPAPADGSPKPQATLAEVPVNAASHQTSVADVSMDIDDSSSSLMAKVELVETRLPSCSPPRIVVDQSSSQSPARRFEPPADLPLSPQTNQENTEPLRVEVRSPTSSHTLARTVSREDGEIFSPPPPKPLPLAPRAHSPPTHPRSFHSGSTSPVRPPPPPPPPRRPLQPAPHRSQLQNGPPSSRPLPSGPRALRGLSGSGSHYYPPFSGGGGAPRAPSADRDRDRDRDHRMDWDRDTRRGSSWGRGRGGGWGR